MIVAKCTARDAAAVYLELTVFFSLFLYLSFSLSLHFFSVMKCIFRNLERTSYCVNLLKMIDLRRIEKTRESSMSRSL